MFKWHPKEWNDFIAEEKRKMNAKLGTNDDLNVVSQGSARVGSAVNTPGNVSSTKGTKKASPNKTVSKKGKKSTSKGKKQKEVDPMANVKSSSYEVSIRQKDLFDIIFKE